MGITVYIQLEGERFLCALKKVLARSRVFDKKIFCRAIGTMLLDGDVLTVGHTAINS